MHRGDELTIKNFFKRIRNWLVINQVKYAKIPEFAPDRVCRKRIVFSGRVQKVGFRLEVSEMAKRLGLTGSCMNLPDGNVLAELQGQDNRIRFLISFMESLKRIRIDNKIITELEPQSGEVGFLRK